MTSEQLRQVQELFHAVRERSAEDRAALLAQAEPEVRREVESLLARQFDDLVLNRPVLEVGARLMSHEESTMPSTGMNLGPYRVEGKLGQGGMGAVFR